MSFSLIGSSSTIKGSLSRHNGEQSDGPRRIEFPSGWGDGPLFDWYINQKPKVFDNLQLRKEHNKPFQHEYITLRLENGWICRLDRRGDGGAAPAEAISPTGITAVDTLEIFPSSELEALKKTSAVVLELTFPKSEDLLSVLAICYAIQQDEQAKRYTLQRYNCYFFSMAVISCIARRIVAWESLASEESIGALSKALKNAQVPKLIQQHTWHKQIQRAAFLDSLQIALYGAQKTLTESLSSMLLRDRVRDNLRSASRAVVADIVRVVAGQAFSSATLDRFSEVFRVAHCNKARDAAREESQPFTTDTAIMRTSAAHAASRAREGDLTRIAARDAVRATISAAAKAAATDVNWDAPAVAKRVADRAAATDTRTITRQRTSDSQEPARPKSGRALSALCQAEWDTTWATSWEAAWRLTWQLEWLSEWQSSWQKEWDLHWESEWELGTGTKWNSILVDLVNDRIADAVLDALPNSGPDMMRIFVARPRKYLKQSSIFEGYSKFDEVFHADLQKHVLERIKAHSVVVETAKLGSASSIYMDMEEAICRIWAVVSSMALPS